ncbi:MAG TPA: protein kinase [Myxococcales bacterium]|nr:protein kinase [Myxococcales bacterium]
MSLELVQADPPPPADPLIGCLLGGHYRIKSLLGRGGMSSVYQALQSPLERAVALKVIKDDPDDESLRRRFLFEASATSRLTHPNTITIFDYGADQGWLYFAMELLRGSNMAAVLKHEGRFSEQRTLHMARQICRSLREAHAKGLVHRDLKPSNFFLLENADEPDYLKVLDFGLVKVFGNDEVSEQLTGGGLVLGTPHYMAPEQARGRACDQRSDIYSLGVVLFLMLSGHVPFDGASAVDVHLAHATLPVPLLRTAHPDLAISPQLEAVVAKCMAKKPEDRFRSMDELLSALPGDRPIRTKPPPLPADYEDEAHFDPVPSGKQPTQRMSRSGGTPPISAPTPAAPADDFEISDGSGDGEAPRRTPTGVVVALAAAIAISAAGIAWARHGGQRSPGTPPPAPVATDPVAQNAPPPPEPVAAAPQAAPAPQPPPQAQAQPEPAVAAPKPPPAPEPVAAPAPAPVAPHPKAAPKKVAAAPAKAAAPKAAPASPEAIEAVREQLGRAISGIRQCAMLETRRGGPDLSAEEVTVTATVDPSGQVSAISFSGASLPGPLDACIRGAVKRVKFDPFEGGPATVSRAISLAAH